MRERLNSDVVERSSALQELQQTAGSLRVELVSLRSTYAADTAELRGRLAEAQQRTAQLEEAERALAADRAAALERLQQHEMSEAGLRAELADKAQAIAALEAEAAALRTSMEGRVRDLTAAVERLQQERDGLDRERDSLHRSLEEMASELHVQENELRATRARGTPKVSVGTFRTRVLAAGWWQMR